MKKSTRKLVLAREIVGNLELWSVRGGDNIPTAVYSQCTCPDLKPERVQ